MCITKTFINKTKVKVLKSSLHLHKVFIIFTEPKTAAFCSFMYVCLDIYQDSHFEVICDEGLSKEFALKIGCKTGDPASSIFFIVDLDKDFCGVMDVALDKLSILDERYISPIPVGGMLMM